MDYTKINIQSDFTDFYDKISDKNGILYNRNLSSSLQRGTALKFLRNMGIKTIELKQVRNFSYLDNKLVVYTDTKKHGGLGKKICNYNDAVQNYSNNVASKFITDTDGKTVKFLQIGERRFSLTFQKEEESLELGKLIDIREISSSFNRYVGLPIFSIDYIRLGNEMVATDFNEVENLSKLGINYYLTAEEIEKQILESMRVYNLILNK